MFPYRESIFLDLTLISILNIEYSLEVEEMIDLQREYFFGFDPEPNIITRLNSPLRAKCSGNDAF